MFNFLRNFHRILIPAFLGFLAVSLSPCPILDRAYSECTSTAMLNSGNIPMTTFGGGMSHVTSHDPSSGSLSGISDWCRYKQQDPCWTTLWVCWVQVFPLHQARTEGDLAEGKPHTYYLYVEVTENGGPMPGSTRPFCPGSFQENWLDYGQGWKESPKP